MSQRMTREQKALAIEFVRNNGTLIAGARGAGVTYQILRNEIRNSPAFARHISIAQNDGQTEIGDHAIANIKRIASELNTDVRSRLTANLALANWAVPGFRGETRVLAKVEHNIRVNTAIPRPVYIEKETPKDLQDPHPERRNMVGKEDKANLAELNMGLPARMLLSPPKDDRTIGVKND